MMTMTTVDQVTRERLIMWGFRLGFFVVGALTLYLLTVTP